MRPSQWQVDERSLQAAVSLFEGVVGVLDVNLATELEAVRVPLITRDHFYFRTIPFPSPTH